MYVSQYPIFLIWGWTGDDSLVSESITALSHVGLWGRFHTSNGMGWSSRERP